MHPFLAIALIVGAIHFICGVTFYLLAELELRADDAAEQQRPRPAAERTTDRHLAT